MSRLELALFAGSVAHAPGETVLVPLPEDERPLGGDAGRIDWRLRGEISRKLLSGYLTGARGEAALIESLAPLRSARLLVLGVGPREAFLRGGPSCAAAMMQGALQRLCSLRFRDVLLALPSAIPVERCTAGLVQGAIQTLAVPGPVPVFRLVIPDSGGLGRVLEDAAARLAGGAHARGLDLEVTWVSSDHGS